jgi:hypothetical protein
VEKSCSNNSRILARVAEIVRRCGETGRFRAVGRRRFFWEGRFVQADRGGRQGDGRRPRRGAKAFFNAKARRIQALTKHRADQGHRRCGALRQTNRRRNLAAAGDGVEVGGEAFRARPESSRRGLRARTKKALLIGAVCRRYGEFDRSGSSFVGCEVGHFGTTRYKTGKLHAFPNLAASRTRDCSDFVTFDAVGAWANGWNCRGTAVACLSAQASARSLASSLIARRLGRYGARLSS